MPMRSVVIAFQVCLLTVLAHAQPAQNPPGFNAPDGHAPDKSQSQAFSRYKDGDIYLCLPQKKPCTDKDPGFDAKGYAVAEGAMVTTAYRRSDGQRIEGLLLQRNYERVIREMGGRLQAVMSGQSEDRGQMKQVHLLERNGQRQWVMVNTWSDSNRLQLTVVTLGDAPSILSAAELQKQIDSQGFATLNVNFDTNKSELREADRPTLEQVVQLLKGSPALRLSVDGHTDNVGQPPANKLLSQQRAQAIVDHLVAAGIARDRLVAKGYGMEVPVGDNRSEDGRAKNRRVELVKLTPASRASAPEPVQPDATAPAKASVHIVAPEALAEMIKAAPQLVVLFTSPSPKCGFCIGADVAFEATVAQQGDGSGWRYVRTEWPEWKQYPPVAQASGVLGLPDHVVFRNGSVVGRVTGRIKDSQELARKILALQPGS